MVRAAAELVAGMDPLLRRPPDPVGAGVVPRDLLLLPRVLLQGVLGRPSRVHGRRAARVLPRRAVVPPDPAERAPLLPLPGRALPFRPRPRRVGGALVRRPGHGASDVRRRRGDARPGHQRRPPRRLHPGLPFPAPPGGRRAGRDLTLSSLPARVRRRERAEPVASPVGLGAWGAVFDRPPDGRILHRSFGGRRYPRLAQVGDRTGLEMIRPLQDRGVHQGIDVPMECTVTRLLVDDGRVVGAFGFDRPRGRFKVFEARAVVLATGGIGRAYKITSNSWEYTGDGHALAYAAGADPMDMEFVQFHPTGMIWPPSVQGILVTESVRGEGGILTNKDGRRFMFADIPEAYKGQTADNEEEGWRYTQGDK